MNIMCKNIIFKPRYNNLNISSFQKVLLTLPRLFCSKKPQSEPVLLDPTNKIAVVTGGTGDIGVSIASELLKNNVQKVALLDLNPDIGLKAINELTCVHGCDKVVFLKCDVSLPNCVKDAFKTVSREYGNFDILVNAAGYWNEKDWEGQIESNLFGIITTNIFATFFMNPNGIIINVSGSGFEGISHSPILSASFSGIVSASRCFGHKDNTCKSKIRVTCLCLGITKTKFIMEAEKRQLTKGMSSDLEVFLKSQPTQTTEPLKVSVIHLIKYAQTGTVWVADDYKLYTLEFPNWKTYATMEARFM
ncbi:unnamed protein product [Brassicogethes aeneus]|uniref:Uncharacterized protein n=1 Tax=Brassicogethes aeneus TaxID=1431903 RepID=A0A9P0F913_BRAAE|nr:unnamed protein product [Brassicogethes aeneus]